VEGTTRNGLMGGAVRRVIRWVARLAFLAVVACGSKTPGKEIGSVDLMKEGREVVVDATPGALRFSLDVRGASGRTLHEMLERSRISVTVSMEGLADKTGSCAATRGVADDESDETSGRQWKRGVALDCAVPIAQAGSAHVRVTVEWANDLALDAAVLSVRQTDDR
jgi:hypothetical protein